MEACQGVYYWARMMRKLGHDVRLISPQFVTPYHQSHITLCLICDLFLL